MTCPWSRSVKMMGKLSLYLSIASPVLSPQDPSPAARSACVLSPIQWNFSKIALIWKPEIQKQSAVQKKKLSYLGGRTINGWYLCSVIVLKPILVPVFAVKSYLLFFIPMVIGIMRFFFYLMNFPHGSTCLGRTNKLRTWTHLFQTAALAQELNHRAQSLYAL